MARAGATYPQVEPGAAGLMDRRVAACPPAASVRRALGLARRSGARVLVLGGRAAVRRAELERAGGWGLGRLRVEAMAWHDLPAMPEGRSEIAVRRLLMDGAPMVLVRRSPRTVGVPGAVGVVGAVDGAAVALARPALSVAHRLEHPGGPAAEACLWLLRLSGKLAEADGIPAYAVGGVVRDILLGRPPLDVDLVVEGDGAAFACRLAPEIGGRVRAHPTFGTASIEDGRSADGTPLGRVDVAMARRERYAAPGALPEVSPAPLAEDLARRDFSVNAMALTLAPAAFGRLVDVPGAQRDLARRRLRPLHPLAFVEDPTRIFRAARYAARLGFRMDALGRRAVSLALAVGGYPRLSGQRLSAEIALIAREATGWQALERLLRWQALRLWDPRYRVAAVARGRLTAARRLEGWARRAAVAIDGVELVLVALLLDQPRAVARRCLARLAITGAPARRLAAALGGAAALARRLARPPRLRPSAIDRLLADQDQAAVVGAWLVGGRLARRRIEWFLTDGRAARPLLTGADLARLGVPRGPAVGRCLAALRRRRLDGGASTLAAEEDFVNEWRGAEKGDPR